MHDIQAGVWVRRPWSTDEIDALLDEIREHLLKCNQSVFVQYLITTQVGYRDPREIERKADDDHS